MASFALLLLLALFVGPWWYVTGAESAPEFGVSFSCRQTRYLGDNCAEVFTALLRDLGVRHLRVSLYWSEIEIAPGDYNFAEADMLARIAAQYGADLLMTVGIKAQRYPEAYVPGWLTGGALPPQNAVLDTLPRVRDAALAFVRASIEHFADNRVVVAWQVENEPFIKNFDEAHGWTVSQDMTAAEAALVRQDDPLHRPVVVTHSAWTIYDRSWKQALATGDVLGENLFTKKAWLSSWSYFFPYESGPFTPNLPGQAAAARRAGKQLWITELQAEPEEKRSLLTLDAATAKSITPRMLQANVELARRSGANRVYLWGAEWWYHQHSRGLPGDLWPAAAALFAHAP